MDLTAGRYSMYVLICCLVLVVDIVEHQHQLRAMARWGSGAGNQKKTPFLTWFGEQQRMLVDFAE